MMTVIIPAVFVLALLAIVPTYALYFISLHRLGQDFNRLYPVAYENLIAAEPPSIFSITRDYRVFQAIQAGKISSTLDPKVLYSYNVTRKRLLLGISCFMVLLFSGLAISLNK